jgi:hypothetical protein
MEKEGFKIIEIEQTSNYYLTVGQKWMILLKD